MTINLRNQHRVVSFCLAIVVVGSAFGGLTMCREAEPPAPVGDGFAEPVAILPAPSGENFLVLSSNRNRFFKDGSLALLSKSGEKLKAFSLPSLATNMAVAGDEMVITYDHESPVRLHQPKPSAKVVLYAFDETERTLSVKKTWDLDPKECIPQSVAMTEGYRYFAVACRHGSLLVGDLEQQSLTRVRAYPRMDLDSVYLDSESEMIVGLPSKHGRARGAAAKLVDKHHWDPVEKKLVEGEDGIPDDLEGKERDWDVLWKYGSHYRGFVFDLQKYASDPSFKDLSEDPDLAREESWWVYYSDPGEEEKNKSDGQRHYRTNFVSTQPTETSGVFTVGERPGRVLEVTTTDLRGMMAKPFVDRRTEDHFDFKVLFGAPESAAAKASQYLTDYNLIKRNNPAGMAVASSLRERESFDSHESRLQLSALAGQEEDWYTPHTSSDLNDSYISLAVIEDRYVLLSPLGENKVILFEIDGRELVLKRTIH